MASEELEKSLRADIDGYVNSRLNTLQEEIKRLQKQLNESMEQLLARATSNTQSDTPVGVSILEHIRAAHDRGVEDAAAESPRLQSRSDIALLRAAIEDIDDQRSQTDILNSLVNRAAAFAPRIGFFIVKNGQTIGWRARGLEGTVGDDRIREISLPLTTETVLSDVVNSRATWSGSPGSHAGNHELLSRFGEEPPERVTAIPLIARGRAVAVLYADSAALESDAINLEALETLVRVAGMAVELLTVARAAPDERPAARIEPTPERARVEVKPPPPAPERVQDDATLEASSPAAEEVVEEETAISDVAEAPPMSEPLSPSQPFANPLGTARRYSGAEAELPVDVNDDERPQHVGAQRFARLLVSEIKMYNEQKVTEGRSEGDLYDRLRETIDRSREMYDKRYADTVGSRYDYFHRELVDKLAEGDEAKLGAGYPGSSVRV